MEHDVVNTKAKTAEDAESKLLESPREPPQPSVDLIRAKVLLHAARRHLELVVLPLRYPYQPVTNLIFGGLGEN